MSDGSNQVDLGLPLGTSSSAGVEIAPSSTLYTSSSHFSVAATLTTSGMRESVSLENSSAPSSYSFPVTLSPGEFLASNPDGSVSVMKSFSGGSISVGTFEAPWATDATGALIPTSYSVQGSTLVQTVQTTPSTVYPVVADPYITWGWGPYWNLTGATIKRDFPVWQDELNSDATLVGRGLADAGFGYLVGKLLGGAVGGVIATALGILGGLAMNQLFPVVSSADINRELINIDTSACFQYTLPGNLSYSIFNPQPLLPILYNQYGFPNSWIKVPNSNCAGE